MDDQFRITKSSSDQDVDREITPRIPPALGDDQMVDVGETTDDVVAVQRRRRDGVEDRELEEAFAQLRHPVLEGEIGHETYNGARQGTCQCKVVNGRGSQ